MREITTKSLSRENGEKHSPVVDPGSESPRVLCFGSGHDSVLQCAAATIGVSGPPGYALFVEEDEAWAGVVREELAAFLTSHGLPLDRCEVRVIHTPTHRAHWIDWLGRHEALATATARRIFAEENDRGEVVQHFDVVIVDGPCGCNDVCTGRMAAFSTAPYLVNQDTGIVFADDLDRTVRAPGRERERVFGRRQVERVAEDASAARREIVARPTPRREASQ